MKHYPSTRHPAPLAGLSHERQPWHADRVSRLLAAACLFAAGFFSGAILFGLLLITTP